MESEHDYRISLFWTMSTGTPPNLGTGGKSVPAGICIWAQRVWQAWHRSSTTHLKLWTVLVTVFFISFFFV